MRRLRDACHDARCRRIKVDRFCFLIRILFFFIFWWLSRAQWRLKISSFKSLKAAVYLLNESVAVFYLPKEASFTRFELSENSARILSQFGKQYNENVAHNFLNKVLISNI